MNTYIHAYIYIYVCVYIYACDDSDVVPIDQANYHKTTGCQDVVASFLRQRLPRSGLSFLGGVLVQGAEPGAIFGP